MTVLLVVLSSVALSAQNDRRSRRQARRDARNVTAVSLPDSLTLDSLSVHKDSLAVADSLHRADSLSLLSKSSLDLPAFSGARDSIVEVFTEGKRMVYYYGDVKVSYQNIELTAEYMEYDMNTGEVFACGVLDPETGEFRQSRQSAAARQREARSSAPEEDRRRVAVEGVRRWPISPATSGG